MGTLNKKEIIFLMPCVLLLAYVTPLGLGLLCLALAPFLNSRFILFSGILLVIFTFFIINSNKVITNDLFWYSQHYFMNNGSNIYDVFSGYRAGVQARWGEPFYHLTSYFLSNISDGNYNFFVFFISFSVYLGSILSVYYFIFESNLNKSQQAIVLIFFLFFGIIFTQSLHLIRQYLACTLLLSSFVFFIKNKTKLGLLFTLLAFLTHNSTLIVSIVFFSTLYISTINKSIGYKTLYGFITALFWSFLYIFLFIITGNETRLLIDDGSVSSLVKVIDLLLFFMTIVVFKLSKNTTRETQMIYIFYITYCVFLFVLHYSHFLSLRYYFFLDFLRWIPCYIVMNYFFIKRNSLLTIGVLLVVFSIVYFNLRFITSPFDYRYSFLEYLVYPIIK